MSGGGTWRKSWARQLGLQYLFAAEFVEHGQAQGRHKPYHGQTILTALPAGAVRLLRFDEQSDYWRPRWYLPNWGWLQRRSGGRLALVAELGRAPRRLVVYNVHLESRGPEQLRLAQMRELLQDVQRYGPQAAVVVAGDFNTRTSAAPAAAALRAAGFRMAVGGAVTTRRGAALDWIFVRGPLTFDGGRIEDTVEASDHYPLTVRLGWGETGCR